MTKRSRHPVRSEPTKKQLTQEQVFKECLRTIQELVDTMEADAGLGLVKTESNVVDKITKSFLTQTEITGDDKPVPLTNALKGLLTPLVRAGRGIDLL